MKANLNILLIVVFLCSAFAKAESIPAYDKECIYVVAKNGLNMRETPDAKGKILARLPYGTKLDWTPPGSNDIKTYVIDNGKKIEGYWVKVWRSVPYKELEGNQGGYVFSAYLSYHLKEIPERSLYLFNSIAVKDREAGKSMEGFYNINKDTYNYSAYLDCYPWYDEHPGAFHNSGSKHISNGNEFLKKQIRLELVDYKEVVELKKETDYELDYSFKPKRIPLKKKHKGLQLFKYYLPLKNGDSVEVRPQTGEYPMDKVYVGEFKKQEKYLLVQYFEGIEYYYIDKVTGEFTDQNILNGSPCENYCVYHGNSYIDSGAEIYISYLDNNKTQGKSLFINFQSWQVSENLQDSFWISDNEIILKVHPIDNKIQEVEMDQPVEPHWQYLKLTIL